MRANEMDEALVRRRPSLLSDIVRENNLYLSVSFVLSQGNKADILTRFPQAELLVRLSRLTNASEEGITLDRMRWNHLLHLFGVNRTFFCKTVTLLHKQEICRKVVV